MQEKAEIMDEFAVSRAINRIAYEILERNKEMQNVAFVGIQTTGVVIAKNIARKIKEMEGISVPVGSMDITFYRDDLTLLAEHPVINGNDIAFTIHGKNIVLVDDVLFSGRTIRAAIESLFDMGRPDKIELAVLVDRGHRELPIRADYVGKNVPTAKNEYIYVDANENNIRRVSVCAKV
ncbi:MAG: bifunctional pyr operon transcriptional regulator/uracil phosphoribosyltransferase PyrR [Clostridia bacterium]|nr:bifunctional pyr operon transcriptional regulator/uracil phosphoribosyltransferase PyrR [Clostridia bacterium]